MSEVINYLPVLLIFFGSLILISSMNWRWTTIALVLQYLAMFWLITQVWPIGLASVKLITGLAAAVVLSATRPAVIYPGEASKNRYGQLFYILASVIVWAVVVSLQPMVAKLMPLEPHYLIGGLGLMAMGLLQLGVTTQPQRVIPGLLSVLAGFEILYSAVEASILVAGLLSVINLGLALVGAYMITNPQSEGTI